jgi:universal stress protein E
LILERLIMKKVTRILAVLDGSEADAVVISKAVAIAHQQRAGLELFLCDAERAYSLRHAYDQSNVDDFRRKCVWESRRYLECLRDLALGADVPITVDAACESPLYEAIVRKVARSRADFVIKSAAGSNRLRRFALDASDWQLMRACPATLLLSRSRSWQPCPRFVAAVDMSAQETAGLPGGILQICRQLSQGCHGHLDIVYSEPKDTDPDLHQRRIARLQAFAADAQVGDADIHILSGGPEQALPTFTAGRGYDAVVMGALTHRRGLSALVGTLTSKLVESLDCDFVLVKPDDYRTGVELTTAPGEASDEEPEYPTLSQPPAAPGFVSPWQLPGR